MQPVGISELDDNIVHVMIKSALESQVQQF
jgi:hypothetical protein